MVARAIGDLRSKTWVLAGETDMGMMSEVEKAGIREAASNCAVVRGLRTIRAS